MSRLFELRKTIALPFVLLGLLGLSACNTAEGVGEDLESAGEKIQEESK